MGAGIMFMDAPFLNQENQAKGFFSVFHQIRGNTTEKSRIKRFLEKKEDNNIQGCY